MNPTINTSTDRINGISQRVGVPNAPSSSQDTGSAILNNTPVNSTPSASDLSNNKSIVVPSSANNGQTPAISAINNVNSLNASQQALLNTTDKNSQNAQDNYDSSQKATLDLINQYMGKGQDQINLENQAGIPLLRTQSNQLTQQYLSQQATYNQQYNDLLNKPGVTAEQSAQAIADLQQKHGFELTDTGIRQSIAQNDYNNAQTLVNHQIDIKYGTLKDAIDFGMQFVNNNKDLLSQKDQNTFQANLAVQQQMYTQGQYYDHLQKDTQVQMIKDAASQGAPQDVLNNMSDILTKNGSIGDVAAAGGEYLKNGNYTVTQTGIDQSTGLPIYSKFNPKTGTLEPLNYNGALGASGSQDTVVNGYQMGATTTLGAYASATSTQVNNIKSTVSKIQSTVGNITDPSTAQAAINVLSPNSPITGNMVMSAASKYGVDPSTLIGVMQAETQLGTDGSKGATQNNWGNVGNTDSLMASGKSVTMKPQDGVDAVAKNLAMRQVQMGQNDPAQTPDNSNLTPVQKAGMIIKAAPALLQPAMNYTQTGDVYIDNSKVPTNLDVMKQSYASKTGIPTLNADQAAVVKGADEAARNITQVIAPAWQEIAPKNTIERGNNTLVSPISKMFDTDFFAKNNTFSSNRESLAQQIRALSQSAPKGSLLSTAEAALPSNQGYGKILGIGTYDTLKDGNMKMQRTLDLLNQTIQSYLPNATPIKLDTSQPATPQSMVANGVTYTVGADGKYYPANK